MGEPLRHYDDEEKQKGAYDRAKEAWGMENDAAQKNSEEIESARDRADKRWGMNSDEIAEKEKAAEDASESDNAAREEEESGFYKDEGKPSKQSKKLPKKTKAAGGIIGLLLTGGVLFSIIFAPIAKLDSFLSRINERVFGVATSAVTTRIDYLFSTYMASHIANLESCNRTRSSDCKADYTGKGLASGLFATWRDVKVEEKIFDRLGFTVESTNLTDSANGRHQFTLRDRRGNKITFTGVDDFDRFKSGNFTGGRRELGRELRAVIKDEMKHDGIMQRRSVKKYLERKHGLKLYCFFACNKRDNADQKVSDVKLRYKQRFVDRFILPISPKYGFIMGCLLSGGAGEKCSADTARKKGLDRSRLTKEQLDELVARVNSKPDGKLSQVIIDEIIERVMKESLVKGSVKAGASYIPVAGQVYFALQIIDMIERADSFVDDNGFSRLAAQVNAPQYIEFYSGMRTIDDERKNGQLSLEEIQVVVEDFEDAEDSRIYQARYGGGNIEEYAAADTEYKCNNGNPIPEDEFVCNEKKVARSYAVEEWRDNPVIGGVITQGLSNYRRCYGVEAFGNCGGVRPKTYVRNALGFVDFLLEFVSDAVLKPVLDGARFAIENFPPSKAFMDYLTGVAQTLIEGFFQQIFPYPITEESPGRVKYDGLEAGGELVAYEFAQGGYDESDQPYGLGGTELSPSEARAIEEDYNAQLAYEYQRQPFFDRLTDTEYQNSFANQALFSLPTSRTGIIGNFLSLFSNLLKPLEGILTLGSAFTGNAQAASDPIPVSPFGIPKYGYTANSPDLTRDPAELTEEYCEQAKAEWEASRQENEITGFDEYTKTNPCLLEEAAIEGAGLIYSND